MPPFTSRVRSVLGLLAMAALAGPLCAQIVINDLTVESGELTLVADPVLIKSSGPVVVKSGGTLILWTAGRVNLTAGFRAEPGAAFRTILDSDYDGFSDEEEARDTDGDGIFDAMERRHGLNPNIANSMSDGDKAALLAGHNIFDPRYGKALPPDIQLVLQTPANNYLGINTSTWAITSPFPLP